MGDDQSCSDVLICAIVHLFSWIYDLYHGIFFHVVE